MSSENLLTKFDQLAQRFQQEFQELIEEERAKLKAEIAEYNPEKERMKALTVNDNDIIHLNIGGQKLTTKRSTLCQVENSFLVAMFSGRWEESLERDQDGAVFLDFNAQYFVGYIFLNLQHFATKLGNSTNFEMLFPGVIKSILFILPGIKFGLSCILPIS